MDNSKRDKNVQITQEDEGLIMLRFGSAGSKRILDRVHG